MVIRDQLDADWFAVSFEDIPWPFRPEASAEDARWFWELVNRTTQITLTGSTELVKTKVRTSTQPESLILAQSERWRQA